MARNTRMAIGLIAAALGAMGCGGGTDNPTADTPPGQDPSQPVSCNADNCGDATFRAAIPSRSVVKIGFGTSGSSSNALVDGNVAGSQMALDDVSEVYLDTLDYVDEINEIIDEVFDDLEFVAGTSPDTESDSEHLWRETDPDNSDVDVVLDIDTEDERMFYLHYYEGPVGFEPDEADAIITGTIEVNGDDELVQFELAINLDNLSDADDSIDATGFLDIAALPFAGGDFEVRFDMDGVSFGDESPEDSITTYWIFEEGSYGLEYLAEVDDEVITAYVRWDDEDGRYDHHVEYVEEELGLVDEIVTNCWYEGGEEVFDAYALIDQELDYYGELDGEEADCGFGPVDGHPDPGEDFDNLPEDGEWEDLELLADEVIEEEDF